LPIRNRELFLRYAIPCGEVLVGRGELREDLLKALNDSVKNGLETDFPIEGVFRVATRMCSILAKRMGREEIDDEVIRRYFLLEHEKAIRWRKEIRPDLKVRECMVYPGRVLRIDPDRVLVRTEKGEGFFRNDFAEGLKKKDWVSVHYDYVSERLRKRHADRMMRRKDG